MASGIRLPGSVGRLLTLSGCVNWDKSLFVPQFPFLEDGGSHSTIFGGCFEN